MSVTVSVLLAVLVGGAVLGLLAWKGGESCTP
ncbi:hypothetical protein Dthio_PD1200 [Desulfonatronospira thiodismutans ASO3-1]|uniref:Uncharacterized protein n=1 Tax=Desulfonatronospira thiodismutans ASO3-1 TaxID=555779 RepID=D6ST45_9BACT|nr:hypothetical protein Dthio_PD1200 [Desulfonatronospira thiodismutans ASO3-1]